MGQVLRDGRSSSCLGFAHHRKITFVALVVIFNLSTLIISRGAWRTQPSRKS